MATIGQRLRNGREDKGASRVDVSQETKIAVHHLAALEYSDFKELPDMVHVKGYVRAYAEFLGLEPAAVLEEFLAEYEAQRPSQGEDPRDEVVRKMSKLYGSSGQPWFRRLRPVWVVVALALALTLVWVGWGRFGTGGGGETDTATAVPGRTDNAGPAPARTEIGEAIPESTDRPAAETRPDTAGTEAEDPRQYVVFRDSDQEPAATDEPVTRPSLPETQPAPEVTPEPVTPSAPRSTSSAPETEAAAPPPETQPAASPVVEARLSIRQSGVGTGVENRQLVGESDSFRVGAKVTFWTRVEGGRSGDTIRHVWRHEGAQIAAIPLRIGGSNWRTYSKKTMHAGSAGAWTVEAVDEAGNVLARAEFSCLP